MAAITSDLAGFGLAAASLQPQSSGISILKRSDGSFEDQTLALTDLMESSLSIPARAMVEKRIDSYRTAYQFSWDTLFSAYTQAYELSLTK